MKALLVLFAATLFAACTFVANPRATRDALTLFDSKEQPKDVVLNKNPKTNDPKGKPSVPFSHENHATKNYSADLKSVLGCAECHHTDQPKSALTGVLKTSERDEVLTAATLAKPDAKPVKSCASCHAQEGAKPASLPENPVVTEPG